jgi:signal transduction histidine kinase/DNA-binding response OmpR family regulator
VNFANLATGVDPLDSESEVDAKPARAAVVHRLDKGWVESFGSASFEEALFELSLQARLAVEAHQVAISYVPDGDFQAAIHTHSFSEKYEKYNTYDVMPTGEGIWGLVVKGRRAVRMTDEELQSHPQWKNFSDLLDDRGLEHPVMRGWLAVPILRQDGAFVGVLQASDKYAGDFTEEDLNEFTHVANLIAPTFELQYVNQELQQHSKELIAKQRELEVARDAAQAASRAKSEFLANMSHEIRTPMNAVIGLTELVLQSELNDIQRDYLGTVMDSADSLLSVINDILDFSRIEAGMLQFEQVDFQLQDIVGDTVRAQALRAERKHLELACFVDPEIPDALLGDPGRLRQVLTNLISNAIKFTETGEVVVRVEQASNEHGHVRVKFSVHDTGIGIATDQLKSIFEPFEQGDMSTTREFGGTGLGLAICHKLVPLMGGQIDVDSEPGRGSTFRFTAGFHVSDKAKQPAPIPAAIKGLRVLVVDDNAASRTILEQVLLAKGMLPVTAPSALEGFSLLQDAFRAGRPFRLLVSDVHMPHIDGFGLAEMIRADTSLSDLDIIQLMSTGKQGEQQRCQELRIAAQLTKPVKQSELYNVVIRTLGMDAPDGVGWLAMRELQRGELRPLRILLVEDSLPNQKVALAVLSGSGHTTVVANHGQEALSILESQKFDVILMDVQMPVMDGLQTTAAIRAAEDGVLDQHQPIVAMTAHAMSGDRQKCLDAGMDEYVSKPVRRETLFQAIATAMHLDFNAASMPGVQGAATTKKLVDWNVPLGQLRGDHVVLKDITASYINETRENLSGLPEAIATGNAQETRRLAHTVKGAMWFFRAEIAQQCGLDLENLAATGHLASAPELCVRLQSEVERVLPVLQRFVDTGEM